MGVEVTGTAHVLPGPAGTGDRGVYRDLGGGGSNVSRRGRDRRRQQERADTLRPEPLERRCQAATAIGDPSMDGAADPTTLVSLQVVASPCCTGCCARPGGGLWKGVLVHLL